MIYYISKYMLILTCMCSLVWLTSSILMYVGGKKYGYMCSLFGSLSLITFLWFIGFIFFGNKILSEIFLTRQMLSVINGGNPSQHIDVDNVDNILKKVIYLYGAICLLISMFAFIIVIIKDVYTRTIYVYTILGTVLGLIDMIYLLITKPPQKDVYIISMKSPV